MSGLVADGTYVQLAGSALSAEADMVVVGGIIYVGFADLSADGTLTADVHFLIPAGTASLSGEGTLTASVLPIYRLLDPTSEQVYTNVLPFSRYGIDSGKTILINGTVLTIVEVPMMQELDEADYYFLGGHKYQLTQDEYDAFVACGRTDLVEVA